MLKFKEVPAGPTEIQRFTVRRSRVLIGWVFSFQSPVAMRVLTREFASVTHTLEERWGCEDLSGTRHYHDRGWGRPANSFKTRQDAARWLIGKI